MPNAAQCLIQFLAEQGVDRAFCVPGESYLALLDALHGHPSIDLVTCRQEGSAGFMAVADAKLTGRPAILLVSRGPGACNAAIALHTAEHDAVPLIVLIGQVPARDLYRGGLQEVDYKQMFGGIAKWVGEAVTPRQVPEMIARALAIATQGVPGPVVLSVPEDVLYGECDHVPATTHAEPSQPAPAAMAELAAMLRAAERPILLAGHGVDRAGGRQALAAFAQAWQVPVAVSFRRQDLFDNTSPLYAGDMGLRNPDAQRAIFAEADLVIALGTRLMDITTQHFSWPAPGQRLVHVCADPRFLGWQMPAAMALAADAMAVLSALGEMPAAAPAGRAGWIERLHATHQADTAIDQRQWPDGIAFPKVAKLVQEVAAPDAIITLDAGTFGAPFYRKAPWKPPQRLLAPISGAMGFGVPAAVAAALRHPDRQVICAVGDGGVLMTGNEYAVAMARGANVKLLISENNTYASIRIHQERDHAGRVSGTDLVNPDLAVWASSFRVPVLAIGQENELPRLAEAIRAPGPMAAVIRTSLQAVLPRR